jgi:EAL domain-containing protein (putative c-di-GMP-specific phosphodiesterase class I)
MLVLEITETAMMERLDMARTALEAIALLGVRIVIDDFGTGYSSISRLSELPIAGVKIDRAFTRQLGIEPNVDKVMAAITDLAHALDLQVVAEGVESSVALDKLAELGCDYAQGFHLGRPVPHEQLPQLLSQRPIR